MPISPKFVVFIFPNLWLFFRIFSENPTNFGEIWSFFPNIGHFSEFLTIFPKISAKFSEKFGKISIVDYYHKESELIHGKQTKPRKSAEVCKNPAG